MRISQSLTLRSAGLLSIADDAAEGGWASAAANKPSVMAKTPAAHRMPVRRPAAGIAPTVLPMRVFSNVSIRLNGLPPQT